MVHGPGPREWSMDRVHEVVHGPQGGPWTGSTGVVHGPGSMFCIRPFRGHPAKKYFILKL